MKGQERKTLKRGPNEPMIARKVTSIINSVNQQNLKMNNAKRKINMRLNLENK
jgi:hypothetical protein